MDKWTLPGCVFLSLLLLWSSWSLTLCSAYLMMSQECSGRTLRPAKVERSWVGGPYYPFKPSLPCGNSAAFLSWLLLFVPLRRTLPPLPGPPSISLGAHWRGHITFGSAHCGHPAHLHPRQGPSGWSTLGSLESRVPYDGKLAELKRMGRTPEARKREPENQ